MYHFEASRTALYRVRRVLARTSTYHLVLPGFQMEMSYVHHEFYDATVELRMKIKEIVYLSIYSVYLEIYFWPKVYLRIYGVQLLAV